MPIYTRLNGVNNVADSLLVEQLTTNLKDFFEWGLLEAGGYDNVHIAKVGDTNISNEENLIPVQQSGISDGRIWQSQHMGWVWEQGLEVGGTPIAVSGVYVNGAFYPPSGTGTYDHFYDYSQGRVVFNSPIPTGSAVQAEYSYKWTHFYDQSVPWFRQVVLNDFELSRDAAATGVLQVINNYRIQLPAVVVESVASRRFRPFQIGNIAQWISQDFLFHVIAENLEDRDSLFDILTSQKDRSIYLYDSNARASANAYPLDVRNALVAPVWTYPRLVMPPPSGFRWQTCKFDRVIGQETTSLLPLFRAVVRLGVEVGPILPT